MMVKLFCAIVGVKGSFFSVKLNDDDQVDDLKDAIKAEIANYMKDVDPRHLRLYLAKMKDGDWLNIDKGPAAKQLYEGKVHEDIQQIVDGEEADSAWTLKRWLFDENKMTQPTTDQIHVLVVLKDYTYSVKENDDDAKLKDELMHYRQRGDKIQSECKAFCKPILNRIDDIYARHCVVPLPFICVEGSFGMGKSQLAFALGRSRPWFYWPVAIGEDCQCLYKNFESIAAAFREVTTRDDPTREYEQSILSSKSHFYDTASLWTFGFIRALLKHCSKEQNQKGQMIRFEKQTSLYVEKCNCKEVLAYREKMKAEGKVLPFFVLDEMTLDTRGTNMAAFQRNVFRVCGLVVIVMGTDATITNLVPQPVGSYTGKNAWTTVFSRFPPYQSIPFADDDKQTAWNGLQAQFSIVSKIVANSRGRFARCFADRAVQYAMDNPANIKLCDLLDVAFDHVSLETQRYKPFMVKQEGKDAQLMAISYTNVSTRGTSPPPRKKAKTDLVLGTHCMHLHFANLVDDQGTEVDICGGLSVNGKSWHPLCCFPDINEDWLLYLAILGGKNYSGYYDRKQSIDHSTRSIFSSYLKGQGFSTGENTNAVSNDFKTYENMVAHMIFCASRRNGVQGIPFDDFFAGLLMECQDKIQPVRMTLGNTGETIVASDLLDKYAGLAALSRSKIPFLAPPNAEWPQWILDTRTEGCNFGHLVRAPNDERCDVYVCNMEALSGPPLFLCECKFWSKNVDLGAMKTIITGLDTVWNDNWALALVFCVKLANLKNEWDCKNVGCVKVNCRSGRVDWVFQPAGGYQQKLVIVMETGHLKKVTGKSASVKLD